MVGYDAAAKVVAEARRRRVSLLRAAIDLGIAPEEELRRLLDPESMLHLPPPP